MFKKIISIFLMISIVIGLLCFNTSADENDFALVFEDDFEEYEVGDVPPSGKGDIKKWTSVVKSDASPVIVKEYNGNKFLSLGREANQTESAGPRVEKQLSVKTDSFVRLYLKVQTNGQIFQLSLRNLDNTKHTTIFNFSGDTLLSTVPDGIELKSDEFVDLQVDINFKEMKYISYINGSVYESNGTVNSDISVEDGFRIRYGTSISPGNELFLDDVEIYTDDIGLIGGKVIDILSLKTNSDVLLTPYIKESHPKLYVNDFEAIKEKIKTNEVAAKWYSAVKANANTVLNQDPEPYAPEDNILTNTSRRIMYKLYVLALVHAVEDEGRYKERCKERALEEIRNAANFPSWHPNNFLGVAELGGGIAVAYDWMYNSMTVEEREYVRSVILDHTLYLGALSYEGISDVFFVTATSNWNFVCNGGLVLSALAISEDYPQLADYIFNKAAESITYATETTFAPQGASPEGPGYWNYATYNFMNMIAAIDSATVDGMKIPAKFDFSDTPGLSTTLDFPIATQSSVGRFNYGDNNAEYGKGIDLFSAYWVANKYNKLEYAKYQLATRDLKGIYTTPWKNVLKIIWYNPALFEDTDFEFPLDKFYTHDNGPNLVTLRNGWENEMYVGMQGGVNSASHSFLSLGTFIVDALGERWATLIGQGNYRWDGYFGMDTQQRWTYYNCNTEGQNCVVLNPDEGPQQNVTALAKTIDSFSSADESYGVLDLTEAYDKSVNKYYRGVKMYDEKTKVVIQDDIRAKEPIKDGYWFMHTDAAINVADDGKSALLEKNGKKMHLQIVSDFENAKFTYVDAKPLPTSQNPEIQQSVDYGKKLSIDLTGAKDIKLAVVFTPVIDGDVIDNLDYKLTSIDEWGNDDRIGTAISLWDGTLRRSTGAYATSALPLLDGKNFYGVDTLPDYDSNYNVPFTVRSSNADKGIYMYGTGVTNATEDGDEYYVFNWSDIQNNYRRDMKSLLTANSPVLSFSYDMRIPVVSSDKERRTEITFTNNPDKDSGSIRSKLNIIYDDSKFSVNTENLSAVLQKTKSYTPGTWITVEVRTFINNKGKMETAVYVGGEQIYYGTGDVDYSSVLALRQINFKTEVAELDDNSTITYDTHYDDIKVSTMLANLIHEPAIKLYLEETANGVESKARVLGNYNSICLVTAVFDGSDRLQNLWVDTSLENGFLSVPTTDSQYLKKGYVVKSFVFDSLQSAIPQVASKSITLTSDY